MDVTLSLQPRLVRRTPVYVLRNSQFEDSAQPPSNPLHELPPYSPSQEYPDTAYYPDLPHEENKTSFESFQEVSTEF